MGAKATAAKILLPNITEFYKQTTAHLHPQKRKGKKLREVSRSTPARRRTARRRTGAPSRSFLRQTGKRTTSFDGPDPPTAGEWEEEWGKGGESSKRSSSSFKRGGKAWREENGTDDPSGRRRGSGGMDTHSGLSNCKEEQGTQRELGGLHPLTVFLSVEGKRPKSAEYTIFDFTKSVLGTRREAAKRNRNSYPRRPIRQSFKRGRWGGTWVGKMEAPKTKISEKRT